MNDSALNTNARWYPTAVTDAPPKKDPTVRVSHWVACVSELAACNSCSVAMAGNMAARPLVKNGDANISSPLSRNSSQVRPGGIASTKSTAIMARSKSLRIMMRLRSMRSRSTPATGPARIAHSPRESRMPATTRPEPVLASASANTATLLKWSPTSLTICPVQVKR